MRAILVREFGGPEVLRLEELPDPKPQASQVVVRIKAAGVNPVEAYIRTGTYARKPNLPYTPGADGAGEVESVGADVAGFKPGDRVYIAADNVTTTASGTYAERGVFAPTMLHRLPASVTFAQGAAMGVPYGSAYRALFHRAQARPGETVLVHGATGGVGIAAIQLAKAAGMRVFGTGGTDRGLDAVRAHGIDLVLNHREPDYLNAVMKATDGRGVDVVLEMAAHINLDKDLTVLARGGRIVLIGSRGRIEIDPRGAMGRDAAILGMLLFNVTPADMASMHAALVAGLEAGTLKPLVGREIAMADAAAAHEAVLAAGAYGKIVVVP